MAVTELFMAVTWSYTVVTWLSQGCYMAVTELQHR